MYGTVLIKDQKLWVLAYCARNFFWQLQFSQCGYINFTTQFGGVQNLLYVA